MSNLVSAFPNLAPHTLAICVGIVVLLTAVNLRGLRESGRAFAAPTYAFIAVVLTMLGLGLYKIMFGDGVTAGVFRSVDPQLFYFTVTGAVDRFFSARLVLQHCFDTDTLTESLRDRYREHTVDIIMAGILAR